jgi:hypothetical protein
MQGTIDVVRIYREREARQRLDAWRQRMTREARREEEEQVLREYHRASDQQAVVARYRSVFARVRENRRRAQTIELTERRLVDGWMRAHGYVVRPKRVWPRYVRPRP